MRRKIWIITLVSTLIICTTVASTLPGDWWGTVTIDGDDDTDEAVVDAYLNNEWITSSIVGSITPGYYIVTLAGNPGDYVSFKVNNINVNEPQQEWTEGDHNLNLTVTMSCTLAGDQPPCDEVTLSEVVDYITQWSEGEAELHDVIMLITAWSEG